MDLLRPGRKRYLLGILVAVAVASGTISTSFSSQRRRGEGGGGSRVFESFRKRFQQGKSDDAATGGAVTVGPPPPVDGPGAGELQAAVVAPVVAPTDQLPAVEPAVTLPEEQPPAQPSPEPPPAATAPAPGDAADTLDLSDTAVVTMAAGDESARLAIALVQSLRDTQTRIPHIVVMLARGGSGSADCQNGTWKRAVGREDRKCQAPDAIAQEIVSGQFLDTLARLGAETLVVDSVEETEWTSKVPGGRQVVRAVPAAPLQGRRQPAWCGGCGDG